MQNYSPYLFGNRYLNDVNIQYLSSGGVVTTPGQQFNGMLGQKITISSDVALQLTNTAATDYTSSTPLLAGTYQLVKMKSSNTITPARGLAVYWDPTADIDAFIVTTDQPTGKSQFAGFLINAPTAAYYCWILVEGDAYLKGKASSLTDTAAVGDFLTVVGAAGTVDTVATNPSELVALTDSTTGTAAAALAAGTGVYELTIPVTLPTGGTSAVDQLTTLTLGHKFKILAWHYVEAVAATGASGSRVYNMEIGTTDVGTTPSTLTITTSGAAVGRVINGTAVSGANTGTASDTISIEVASGGTTHDAGSGAFVIRIQNMDTADSVASLAAKLAQLQTLSTLMSGPKLVAYEAAVAGTLKRVHVSGCVPKTKAGLQ